MMARAVSVGGFVGYQNRAVQRFSERSKRRRTNRVMHLIGITVGTVVGIHQIVEFVTLYHERRLKVVVGTHVLHFTLEARHVSAQLSSPAASVFPVQPETP